MSSTDDEGLSPYDESVPAPGPDEALAARFAELRELRGARPEDLHAVRDLVLVVSSSRGGSTLLSELLRRTAELVTLPGEVNPYVVVAQLSRRQRRVVVAAEIAAELGRPVTPGTRIAATDLALQAAWRMAAQWPGVALRPDEVERATVAAVAAADPAGPAGPAGFTDALLRALGGAGRGFDLRRYDGAGAYSDPEPLPGGPAADTVVEMTPYRLVQPWQRVAAQELAAATVVLATPRNSFRVAHLARLFPRARVRLLHLTRNPAGAVNGLVDGWLHHGFFNVRMPCALDIGGYSDRFRAWGRWWWKYDVPPTWRTVTSAPLARVAALQWASAHEAALTAAAAGRHEVHRVAYEALVGAPQERAGVAGQLAEWLGLARRDEFVERVTTGVAPVMATRAPRPARWRERECELAPFLADPALVDLAQRLGYPADTGRWR